MTAPPRQHAERQERRDPSTTGLRDDRKRAPVDLGAVYHHELCILAGGTVEDHDVQPSGLCRDDGSVWSNLHVAVAAESGSAQRLCLAGGEIEARHLSVHRAYRDQRRPSGLERDSVGRLDPEGSEQRLFGDRSPGGHPRQDCVVRDQDVSVVLDGDGARILEGEREGDEPQLAPVDLDPVLGFLEHHNLAVGAELDIRDDVADPDPVRGYELGRLRVVDVIDQDRRDAARVEVLVGEEPALSRDDVADACEPDEARQITVLEQPEGGRREPEAVVKHEQRPVHSVSLASKEAA